MAWNGATIPVPPVHNSGEETRSATRDEIAQGTGEGSGILDDATDDAFLNVEHIKLTARQLHSQCFL